MIFTGAFSQQAFQGDICQSIPGLTSEQQQKIDKLGASHQKKMDALRTKFISESNAENAANLKSQMSSEMENHYQNITALLTPGQQSWYEQNCYANKSRNYYARAGYGQSYGRGQGSGRGIRYTGGTGYGRGTGFGRGAGYRRGAGYGWGAGYGQRAACGRGRIVN